MNMRRILAAGFLVVFLNAAQAHPTDSDSMFQIPEGSTLTLLQEVNVLPNTETTALKEMPVDTDGDTVPDSQDHCPGTPPKTAVWTEKAILQVAQQKPAKYVSVLLLGCRSSSDPGYTEYPPQPPIGDCYLGHDQSTRDRRLAKGLELTIGSVEGGPSAKSRYYGRGVLKVKTAKDKALTVVCRQNDFLEDGEYATPKIGALKKFFKLAFSPTEEIE
jgi:hypothetical protein